MNKMALNLIAVIMAWEEDAKGVATREHGPGIERDYLELKQEVGLGHFEGRGWRGFRHHATLCLAAYAFLVSERAAFPPAKARCGTFLEMPAVPENRRPRGTAGPHRAPRAGFDRDAAT